MPSSCSWRASSRRTSALERAKPPAIIGLIVGIVWAYLVGFSDISPFCDVNTWDTVYVAIISLIGILIGALVAVGIFLVVVLKS